jgi:hypothetical protein
VLVIGSSGHAGARCVSWDASSFPNVADYDVVVVNAASLAELLLQPSTDAEIPWRRLQTNLSAINHGVLPLLHSQGQIFCVAVPSVSVQHSAGGGLEVLDAYDWNPLPLALTEQQGETVTVVDPAFNAYLGQLRRWRFIFEVPPHSEDSIQYLEQWYRGAFKMSLEYDTLARNRAGGMLAVRVKFSLHKIVHTESGQMAFEMVPQLVSGPLVALPLPVHLGGREAVNLVLEELVGLPQRTLPPQWVEEVSIPGDAELHARQDEMRNEIERLEARIGEIAARREELAAYKRLLYESGTPLEEVCRATLREMGATVIHEERYAEDGIVEFEGQRASIEVKGNTRSISLGDVRQLAHHRDDHVVKHGEEIKGILFGTPWRLLPLLERSQQPDFPDNVVTFAQSRDIALVRNTDLYEAYCASLRGEVDGREILRAIFAGRGITELR